MAANSKVITLLSAVLTLSSAAGLSALAFARDTVRAPSEDAPILCEPGSCSIVVKTEEGGPPSDVRYVPKAADTVRRDGAVLVAALPAVDPAAGR